MGKSCHGMVVAYAWNKPGGRGTAQAAVFWTCPKQSLGTQGTHNPTEDGNCPEVGAHVLQVACVGERVGGVTGLGSFTLKLGFHQCFDLLGDSNFETTTSRIYSGSSRSLSKAELRCAIFVNPTRFRQYRFFEGSPSCCHNRRFTHLVGVQTNAEVSRWSRWRPKQNTENRNFLDSDIHRPNAITQRMRIKRTPFGY